MKHFFIEIPNFLLGQTNWADTFWGIWGIYSPSISNHFGTVSPLSIVQPLFLQKVAFLPTSHIFIWDWYLDLGRKELGI
jgi:hypothetical protein